MNLDEIKELMDALVERGLRKVVYKNGEVEVQLEKEGAPAPVSAPAAMPAPAAQQSAPVVVEEAQEKGNFVTSPMVGTYYCCPAPEHPPFIKVGDQIDEDTVVCIVEAMKVMNEVKAGVSGKVAEVLLDNAQPVEYGTKLFRIV